jgi:hypothetical protein
MSLLNLLAWFIPSLLISVFLLSPSIPNPSRHLSLLSLQDRPRFSPLWNPPSTACAVHGQDFESTPLALCSYPNRPTCFPMDKNGVSLQKKRVHDTKKEVRNKKTRKGRRGRSIRQRNVGLDCLDHGAQLHRRGHPPSFLFLPCYPPFPPFPLSKFVISVSLFLGTIFWVWPYFRERERERESMCVS